MKVNYQSKLTLMRSFTLGIGFLCNMLICHVIIEEYGVFEFNYYAALTALPMFLPFADFGLGIAWLNRISVSKHHQDQAFEKYTSAFFTFLSISFLFSSILISAVSIAGFWGMIFKNSNVDNLGLYCTLIVVSTFLATPFALSFKKLQFENRVLSILIIQGAMPLVSLCLIKLIILLSLPFEFSFLIPSFSYLFTTLIAFWYSRMNRIVRYRSWLLSIKIVRDSLGIGVWSIALGLFTVLILQVPRLILINVDKIDLALRYSFSLMIILPAMSLFSVLGSTKVVGYLRQDSTVPIHNYRLNQIKSLVQPSILITSGSLFVSIASQYLGFRFLSVVEVLILMPVLLSCCITQFALVVQTPILNLRHNSFLLLLALTFEIVALSFLGITKFLDLVILILFPVWFTLTFKSWQNFKIKTKSSVSQ